MNLLQRFKEYIEQHHLFLPKDKLLLAVSGGVDSVVLCELCRQAGYDFIIAHCNFKLREEASDKDEQFVKELAAKYAVPFYSTAFDTRAIASEQKKSIEETARDLRYAWFEELLSQLSDPPVSHILTAHHADDNIETMAMKFFRGTGIKGLRGMLPKNGKIVRPLLFARKKELEDFASVHQLAYVTDATNLEDAYTRNFFRNRLIPLLKATYPEVEQNLLHNLGRFAEVEELYEQAIAQHKKKLVEQKGNEFHIPVLKLKKATPLRSIVYEIISEFNFTAHQADEVVALLDSETGKYVASSTHRVFKNRNWLVISPAEATAAANIIIEEEDKTVAFSLGELSIERTANLTPSSSNSDVSLDAKHIQFPLLLRKRKTGDYFYPLGMTKKKKVSRFLIDKKLSLSEKENVWVIESHQRIIWVVGHRIDERFKVTDKTKAVLRLTMQTP